MRIAVISDLHIGNPNKMIRDIDVRGNFLTVIREIQQLGVDLLIVNGDLVDDPFNEGAYRWIKKIIQELNIPYLVVAGNHDSPSILSNVFNFPVSSSKRFFYSLKVKELDFICLDSSAGEISNDQLDGLEKKLKMVSSSCFLLLHHPPCYSGCTYMDRKYPLQKQENVWKVIQATNKVRAIICGHYHTGRTILYQGTSIFITPSTMMQIDPSYDSYHVESYSPGWRYIEIDDRGVRSTVKYNL